MFSGQTRYRIEIENFITLSLGVNFFRGAGISATTSFFSSTSASLTWITFINKIILSYCAPGMVNSSKEGRFPNLTFFIYCEAMSEVEKVCEAIKEKDLKASGI